MSELFKIRNFGEYFSDTFQFIKQYGKHYFKNYLKFGFIGLLFLTAAIPVFSIFNLRILTYFKVFLGNQITNNSFITENTALIITAIIAFVIVTLLLIVLNCSYPAYYLQLIGKQPNEKPRLSSIRTLLKNDLKRLVIIGLVGVILSAILIAISVFMLAFFFITLISFIFNPVVLLIFIFVYFLIFGVLVPFFTIWYILTFFYYINDYLSFSNAVRKSFKTIFKRFWTIIGTTFCMAIIVNILTSIITTIPHYILIMFGFFFGITDINNIENIELFSSSTPTIVLIIKVINYCISALVSLFLSHLILIQISLVYYSEHEKLRYKNNSAS